ncbi:hypothetical protein T4A_910 [Trichinella pseudospiralis]|uniref:Uncharacterized protein n=1 Tax=Trichinella pseudospiralis TaxID=6337 RepID=A0A0V1E786_TRIPS|nr:hypothetical protein T4A_910 [Trichinella pseudospiralis]
MHVTSVALCLPEFELQIYISMHSVLYAIKFYMKRPNRARKNGVPCSSSSSCKGLFYNQQHIYGACLLDLKALFCYASSVGLVEAAAAAPAAPPPPPPYIVPEPLHRRRRTFSLTLVVKVECFIFVSSNTLPVYNVSEFASIAMVTWKNE